jgi:hypothetical protein
MDQQRHFRLFAIDAAGRGSESLGSYGRLPVPARDEIGRKDQPAGMGIV